MKIFGKTIGATTIIILLIATSLGATALYLSNEASSSVNVKAPLEVKMSIDGQTDWKNNIFLNAKYGGEMSTFYIRYLNLANETYDMTNVKTLITCTDNLTRLDFEHPDGSDPYGLYYELYNATGVMINCGDFNSITYVAETTADTLTVTGILPSTIPPFGNYTMMIEMYHAPSAYGIYKTTTQVMDS